MALTACLSLGHNVVDLLYNIACCKDAQRSVEESVASPDRPDHATLYKQHQLANIQKYNSSLLQCVPAHSTQLLTTLAAPYTLTLSCMQQAFPAPTNSNRFSKQYTL